VEDDDFEARVARRPPAEIMQIGDFDHDGQATEFLLQVDTLPCGKHEMVLVGISKADPHLHFFSSSDEPSNPLILGDWEWHALRDSPRPVDVVDWHCQDHGNDTLVKLHLSAISGVIRVVRSTRACPDQTKSRAYREILKLNQLYDQGKIPYDEFNKRKDKLIEQLPGDPP
jgi:hypothetical protein